ncbi:HNH endonuclease [Ruminococcus sp. TF12-2]|jgi:5-methylcytosine-specific restriction endonuclease McrA|nr:HNH endonuclease [Ruminococcus sp. TF12-2]
MENRIEYCFVVDKNNRPLTPTKVNKGWYLVRKSRAKLKSKYPMVIQLEKEVKSDEDDESHIVCGIDDGSAHVGLAIVQKCPTKNKVVFKGTIEQRQDVKHLMDVRRGHRHYHRYHKRYRQARFNNRSSSKRTCRLAPSIKQKKDAILRVLYQLNKWVNIQEYHLEDVCIDIRALTDDYKPYRWQYQKSNRLDENLRKATILRDECRCQECGKSNCVLEVHHIRARKYGGADTIGNLITLCSGCHQKTEGRERDFEDRYFNMIKSKPKRFDYAMHVMQGKTYLREKISELGSLHLTNGGETANKRIEWNVEKSHGNDAICVTDCIPDNCDVKEWIIKPMRRKSKAKTNNLLGIRHRDLVSYTYKNGETHTGYVTALYPEQLVLNFQSKTKHCKKVNARKCRLLWKFNKIYWLEQCV